LTDGDKHFIDFCAMLDGSEESSKVLTSARICCALALKFGGS
jgi:hypothetical protein